MAPESDRKRASVAAELSGLGSATFSDADLTEDFLLGGAMRLRQPRRGYRVATDPLFLAASCPAQRGDRVLDVGCGVGAAALALGLRSPGVDIEGVELQPAYAALARRNALINGMAFLVHQGDIAERSLFLRARPYDHIITNPPYYEVGAGAPSPQNDRDLANRETMPLSDWIAACLRRLRSRGMLTLIHRAERLGAIMAALEGRAGDVRVFPLWPREGAPARRVIVQAVKEARGPLVLSPGLALHEGPPGRDAAPFTEAALAVLDGRAALDI